MNVRVLAGKCGGFTHYRSSGHYSRLPNATVGENTGTNERKRKENIHYLVFSLIRQSSKCETMSCSPKTDYFPVSSDLCAYWCTKVDGI